MKRRDVLIGSISLALAGEAGAQSSQPRKKFGYIHQRTIETTHIILGILRGAWTKLGYVEGDTVLLRSPRDDMALMPGIVSELERLGVSALIVLGGPAVAAAARATSRTPIVAIDLESNPIEKGFAASFNRPGGNITGLFMDQDSLAEKWIELLVEGVPQLTRIALLWDPAIGPTQRDIALAAIQRRGLESMVLEVPRTEAVPPAFQRLAAGPATGAVQLTSPGSTLIVEAIVKAALDSRIPTITFQRANAQGGLLLSYGPDLSAYYPRAVQILHRILMGEKVGDIPIEKPDRYIFTINLRTARALGITLPAHVLARADEVIE
jgi:putative ABC transport system substrate-binding protein